MRELKMSINMKVHIDNTFLTRIDFYYRGNRVDLAKIDEKWISLLVVEYCNLIDNLNRNINREPKKAKETSNYKQLISKISNITSVLRTARCIFQSCTCVKYRYGRRV